MTDISNQEHAVELLQQLGLKEYEAKCFVALARLPSATAKKISDISEVPRTRVYDAVRVLESKGLVEVQHSSPQRFRAVDIEEATQLLKAEYSQRTTQLEQALREMPEETASEPDESTHEVWSLTGAQAIRNRTNQLVADAESEVVLVLGSEHALDESLVQCLRDAEDRGVTLVLGAVDEGLQAELQELLPDAEVFVSGLEWLQSHTGGGDDIDITRLLLVDQNTILVSSAGPAKRGEQPTEQAVFGRGFTNGLVVITRRLMATGLLPARDPGKHED